MVRIVFGSFVALVLAACGSTSQGGSDAGPDDAGNAWQVQVNLAPCGFPEATTASIDISERFDLFHSVPFARIEGLVHDAVGANVHRVVASEGACRYLEHAPGNCDPACSSEEICSSDDVCVAKPTEMSGGTLSVKGLKADPVDIVAMSFAPGTYHGPGSLPGDLFDADDEIGARFDSGDVAGLSVGVRGVAAMDLDLTASGFEMSDGADAEITWTPGSDPDACIRVVLNGFNAAHGLPLGDIIQCEGPDTGTLTIPQALVERFPVGETPDVTNGFDWPHSEITRYTRSLAEMDETQLELTVRSTTSFQLSHTE